MARREEWAANNLLTAARAVKCEAVELPPEGSELHPIAERHRQVLLKAKPGAFGFVTVQGKDLFACELSAAMIPRLVRAVQAIDLKYKGKHVTITGTVKDVGKDIVGTIYISLDANVWPFTVQCLFNDSAASSVAVISKGRTVRIVGRVDGKFGNVMVKDCSIQ
jgi:hypothetical protein